MTFECHLGLPAELAAKRQHLRRSFIAACLVSAGAASAVRGVEPAVFDPTSVLTPTEADAAQSVASFTRVKAVLEVRGEVRLKSDRDTGGVKRVPMESKSTLQFHEAIAATEVSNQPLVCGQYYEVAESSHTVDTHTRDLSLRQEMKEVTRICSGEHAVRVIGLAGPLTEPERRLTLLPIATSHLESLLPPSGHAIGEQYTINRALVKGLLQLDAITSGDLTAAIIEEADGQSECEFRGDLRASVDGVATTISVKGRAKFDKQRLVTYMAASLQETRDIGVAEPGFEVTARLRLIRAQLAESDCQVDAAGHLAAASTYLDNPAVQPIELVVNEEGGYEYLSTADWVMYKQGIVDAMARLVRRNKTLAQMNLVNLADTQPGEQITLAAYKQEIGRTLGNVTARTLQETEQVTPKGLRLMRVVSAGVVEDVPVQWINMMISDDEGRHASIVFTLNASDVEAFGDADVQVADSFRFTRRLKSAEEVAEENDGEVAEIKVRRIQR